VHLHPREGAVRFRRGRQEIPARLEFVTDTHAAPRCAHGGYTFFIVEHLLAALHVRGWWRGWSSKFQRTRCRF
jgi:UDP-3-O-acyl-N-acetylglucosamine deacetylase